MSTFSKYSCYEAARYMFIAFLARKMRFFITHRRKIIQYCKAVARIEVQKRTNALLPVKMNIGNYDGVLRNRHLKC